MSGASQAAGAVIKAKQPRSNRFAKLRAPIAHPAGDHAHCAAEAVNMHTDEVARLALQAVARERDELLTRIGVGHQARDAAAERTQGAERNADAAAPRI